MPGWSTSDIGDLSGRCAIVTGANSGIGLHTATALAAHGAEVILGCRDAGRAEAAARTVTEAATGAAPVVMALDLGDLSSVHRFAEEFAGAYPSLDLLVNNAGLMGVPQMLTADDFEMQLGVNHLGHFALTGLLLDRLAGTDHPAGTERLDSTDHPAGTGPGRVVTVSSLLAARGQIRFDDLQGQAAYDPWGAYYQSKLANLLFAFELDRRYQAAGVVSVAAHPGYSATNLQSGVQGSRSMQVAVKLGNKLLAQPAVAGALPSLYAATAPGVAGGEYFGPRALRHFRGAPTKMTAPKAAYDVGVAGRLWAVSEELTGVKYPPPR